MQLFCTNTQSKQLFVLFTLFFINIEMNAYVPVDIDPVELETYEMAIYQPPDTSALLDLSGQVIDGAELDRLVAQSLGETLSWQPGVSSSFYGPNASRPIIRGQSGYRVGIYNSGVGTGDLSSASPDHAVSIDPHFIEEIEVIRGPAALLYGSSSIGGAVEVITNHIPREVKAKMVSGSAEARYDTVNNGRMGVVAVTVSEDKLAVQANGLIRKTDSYKIPGRARTAEYDFNNRVRLPPIAPRPAPNPDGEVPNTQSDTQTGSIGVSWIADEGWVGGSFTVFNTDYGVPSDGFAHGNPIITPIGFGPSPLDVVTIDMKQRKGDLEAELFPQSDWLDAVTLRAMYSDLVQDEFEGAYLGNHFDAQTLDTRLDALTLQIDRWTFAAGGQFSYFELFNRNLTYIARRVDEDTLTTRSISGGLFGLAEYEYDGWQFELGLRGDLQHAERSDLSNVERNDRAFSISLGGSYRISEEGRVGVNLSQQQRIPTADELYVEAPHGAIGIFQIPNPNLNNEQSWGIDLFLEKDRGAWQFLITGFVRRYDNYIFLESQGFEVDLLPAYAYVQRKANFIGAELETSWTVYEDDSDKLVLSALWDIVQGTDTSFDQPLPRIPPMRLGGRVDYGMGNWSMGAGIRHAFAQNLVPPAVFGTLNYQSTTPSYTFVDANISYTFDLGKTIATAFLNATNLTNAQGRNATSFIKDIAPLPGRNISVGLNIAF